MKLLTLTYRIVILGVLSALLLTGCSGSGGNGTNTPESSSKTRNLVPVAVLTTENSVVQGINTLGLDMFLLGDISGNAVVAPFSASLALARLRAGARGETLTAINGVMHLSGLGGDVDSAFNKLDLGINGRIAPSVLGGHSSEASAGAWAQARYGYLLTYLDTLAENYGLWPLRSDFALALDDASQRVNDWTFQAGGVSANVAATKDTRLVLGDTVRLNAAWSDPFDPALTETGWFQPLDSGPAQVPFMRKTAIHQQGGGDGYTSVELPLAGGLRLLLVLPDERRYLEIQSALTAERLDKIAAALTPATVDLALPKFTIESGTALDLGMAASRDIADFSGIDGTRDLFVSSTIHRSRLSVIETGLQAGSATLLALDDAHPETWTDPNWPGYGVYSSSIMSFDNTVFPMITVTLGRPFIFAVRDSATGAILFMGRVMNPGP